MKETIKYSNGTIINSIDNVKSILEESNIPIVNLENITQYNLEECFENYIKLYNED